MSLRRTLTLSLLLGLVTPAAARADGMIIPFFGINFGGDSEQELSDAIEGDRFDWGVSLAYMGGGIVGLEADIGYSPDFFGKTDIGGSSVLTATGNLLIGIPIGGQTGVGFRPYGLGGLGVMRSEAHAFDGRRLDDTNAAWDFGGGAMFFFGTNVGLRADFRYFRTFGRLDFDFVDAIERPGRLDFARTSAGLILRF